MQEEDFHLVIGELYVELRLLKQHSRNQQEVINSQREQIIEYGSEVTRLAVELETALGKLDETGREERAVGHE